MKNLIFLFLILGIISCQNTSDKEIEVKQDISKEEVKIKRDTTLNGIWGLTNYFDTIVANKEIAKYRVQHPTWCSFLLEIRDDSIFNYGSIMNRPELYGSYKIEWNKDTLVKIFSCVDPDHEWNLVIKDTFLTLINESNEHELRELDTTTYIFRRRNDLAYLINDKDYYKVKEKVTNYFNSRLLVGEYRNIKTNRKVIFDENGTVKGITGFDSFEIGSHFGTLHPFSLDVVHFKGKKIGHYNWIFNQNKLTLTEFKRDKSGDLFILGKRKIELERIK